MPFAGFVVSAPMNFVASAVDAITHCKWGAEWEHKLPNSGASNTKSVVDFGDAGEEGPTQGSGLEQSEFLESDSVPCVSLIV